MRRPMLKNAVNTGRKTSVSTVVWPGNAVAIESDVISADSKNKNVANRKKMGTAIDPPASL
jgi:hypothetical protein